MKAELTVNGAKIEVDITEDVVKRLTAPIKKTGYERSELGDAYYFNCPQGYTETTAEDNMTVDDRLFEIGNYYSNKTVAENNARADKLMRQLRRFAVEHREENPTWKEDTKKWYIFYDHQYRRIIGVYATVRQTFATPHFSSAEEVKAAIEAFRDELLWYFTEYKDSL